MQYNIIREYFVSQQFYEHISYNNCMSDKKLEIIGERIKELRAEKKMSQEKLGQLLAVSQDTVSLWENSKSIPPADIIIKLSEPSN